MGSETLWTGARVGNLLDVATPIEVRRAPRLGHLG
jgi:hypothetical protein